MTLTNKTIQYLGDVDGEMFYYDFNRNQLLLSNKKSNPALIMMLVPVTATVSGGILNFLGSQIIIAQFIWRLMLLIGLSVLMHLLASFVSQLIIKKTNFQEVTLSEDRLKLLIKKNKVSNHLSTYYKLLFLDWKPWSCYSTLEQFKNDIPVYFFIYFIY